MNYRMSNNKEDEKKLIVELAHSILNLPDSEELTQVNILIGHLNRLLRINSVTPPITEIMSLLKHQKPALYHRTRLSINAGSQLHILFSIDFDPQLAEERLQEYLQSCLT